MEALMRRSQLVSPFGVGAMSVLVDGTSVITKGLDDWFKVKSAGELVDPTEFVVHDWRLEKRLAVSHFRLPPDHRDPYRNSGVPNTGLTVPVARFPRYHLCPYCKKLEKTSLYRVGKNRCNEHGPNGPVMTQVPFVSFCKEGHLDDFPFNEWVHRHATPVCRGNLRLNARGTGLEKQVVSCDGCGKSRTMKNATRSYTDGSTFLQNNLLESGLFNCHGSMPWLGDETEVCGAALRGGLRGGGNIYFPVVESSIFLPAESGDYREILDSVVEKNQNLHATFYNSATVFNLPHIDFEAIKHMLQNARVVDSVINQYSPEDWEKAYAVFFDRYSGAGVDAADEPLTTSSTDTYPSGDDEWRYPEFQRLRATSNSPYLRSRDPGLHPSLKPALGSVRAIDALKETRVLRGFTRGNTQETLTLERGKKRLRKSGNTEDWLPAYVVQGEGIFIEFNTERLREWESRPEVQQRVQQMHNNIRKASSPQFPAPSPRSARYVMIHTFSHLLMNQLVFECGYSTASIRERLFVSNEPETEMAGLLIYTAAGDSDGTLGGLVGMSDHERFKSTVLSALDDARWCSVDPVCMEAGIAGQGPGSCNMAACHSCALVPETSCEQFNRFLDRALVIGSIEDSGLSYFENAGKRHPDSL